MVANMQAEKSKTKAKKRYLKVKRERRKKRKATAREAIRKNDLKMRIKGSTERVPQTSGQMQVGAIDSEDKCSSPKKIDENGERPEETQKVLQDLDKVDCQRSHSPISSTSSSRASLPDEGNSFHFGSAAGLASHLTPLPALPTPSISNSMYRKTQILQGLDPGLMDAEVIDAAQTVAVDSLDGSAPLWNSSLGLSSKTRKRLKDLGIIELFPVQTALLPFLLPTSSSERSLYMPYNPPRDVCVSAPTGSGKTLAYVLPIMEILSTRVVTRLRALIVLPTRDLVTQVRETFDAVCKGRGIKVGTATGQHSFAHEQSQLVGNSFPLLNGGSSKIDILICTPGRLIDHLDETPNFTLQHLRFLVIDEADRLLTQPFQDWLARVLLAIRPPQSPSPSDTLIGEFCSAAISAQHDALSPSWLPHPVARSHVDEKREHSCQKLLFSATLTRDPAKISALELRDAKYFIVKDVARDGMQDDHIIAGETFTFPATLREHMIVCTTIQKPLMLFYLVHNHGVANALVFTKSAESTDRLVKLFECFEQIRSAGLETPKICAYSSDLSGAERKAILDKFKRKEITILICSDLISRGIDISHVSHVISYDAPVDMRKYVHRVGRTARAGRTGDAWSLIEEHEARYFKSMLANADHLANVRKMKVTEEDTKSLKGHYENALKTYKESS